MATQKLADDSISQGVVSTIRNLADGNGAAGSDVQVQTLTRSDEPVTAQATVHIGWRSTTRRSTGKHNPNGSRRCASADELHNLVNAQGTAAMNDPVHANNLAQRLRADPVGHFTATSDSIRVAELDAYHRHEGCSNCGTDGTHVCRVSGCHNGKVTCSYCNGGGQQRCFTCGGSGTVSFSESVQAPDGSYHNVSGIRACGGCGGSGCSGSCSSCYGSGRRDCSNCCGDGWVNCSPCNATGWFTHYANLHLEGDIQRKLHFAPDADLSFTMGLSDMPLREIPTRIGTVTGTHVATAPHLCTLSLECSVPHVSAMMDCRQVPITLTAVGNHGHITYLNPFLDTVLADLATACGLSSTPPHKLITQLHDLRVGQEMLHSVGHKDKSFDAEKVSERYIGAISADLVTTMHKAAGRAYHGLGRETIRRTWLKSLPVLVAIAVISALYDKDLFLTPPVGLFLPENPATYPDRPWMLTDVALALGGLVVVWLVARRRSLRMLRDAIGQKARRAPRQGILPLAVLVLVAGAHVGTLYEPFDAYGLHLPFGSNPWPPANLWPHGVDLPLLEAEATPPESQMPGSAMMWKMRDGLRQLNYYSGPVNGDRMTPDLRRALESFLEDIPDYKQRYAALPFDTLIDMALHDRVRLRTTIAFHNLMAAFGNIARRQQPNDWELTGKLDDVVTEAALQPRLPHIWHNPDHTLGVEVVVHNMLDHTPGQECGIFDLRIVVRGRQARVNDVKACYDLHGHIHYWHLVPDPTN